MITSESWRPQTRQIDPHALAAAVMVTVFWLATAAPVHAAATLAVDLSMAYRPVTHVAIGFLYGVTEKVPADDDLDRLVGALHPRMLTNPASSDPGTQQPGIPANAVKVASRVARFGTTVTVRLADWFPGWYSFTNMTDWFNKIGTTIAAKKAANLANIYAYEIWNEPNGSWTNGGDTDAVPGGNKTLSWNAFWKQSYDKIRQLDPGVKITGPSISYMDPDFMRGFLTYCKANNCLPDIIGWHEGMKIENDVANYRNLEKQVGVGPLPITINEYSGSGRAQDEGRPGATVPLIAQMERAGVDTACVTWWTPDSIAGHLGSLLASDTQTNGGWFMFKWYGDMTGNMVMTTPSLAKDGKNLDGFASLDASARNAYVVLGGANDGAVQVVIRGFRAAPFFGNKVHVVVERTRWTGRSGVVSGTTTLSTSDLTIANDQVTVAIANTNGDDGYRVSLTVVDSPSDGGLPSDGGVADAVDVDLARAIPDEREAGRDGFSAATAFDGRMGAGGDGGADGGRDVAHGAGGSGGFAGTRTGGSSLGGLTGGERASDSGGTTSASLANGGPRVAGVTTTGQGGFGSGGRVSGNGPRPGTDEATLSSGGRASGCSCELRGSGHGSVEVWSLLVFLVVLVRVGHGGCSLASGRQKSSFDPFSRESSPLPTVRDPTG